MAARSSKLPTVSFRATRPWSSWSQAPTAHNGMRFDNHYCWVVRFEGGKVVEVRAYLDSVLVAELFRQNPI